MIIKWEEGRKTRTNVLWDEKRRAKTEERRVRNTVQSAAQRTMLFCCCVGLVTEHKQNCTTIGINTVYFLLWMPNWKCSHNIHDPCVDFNIFTDARTVQIFHCSLFLCASFLSSFPFSFCIVFGNEFNQEIKMKKERKADRQTDEKEKSVITNHFVYILHATTTHLHNRTKAEMSVNKKKTTQKSLQFRPNVNSLISTPNN